MPRGPAPKWRERNKDGDHLVAAAIQAGYGVYLHYAGIETAERALEVQRSLYRSAKHAQVSIHAKYHAADDGTYYVKFAAYDKSQARAYMLERYGSDPNNWPYNPRAKNPPKEAK